MKENEIALTFINRIGLENIKNEEIYESIKNCLFNTEVKSTNSLNVSQAPKLQNESNNFNTSGERVKFKKDSSSLKSSNLQDENLIQVQLLQHLVYLRNESNDDTHDSSFKEDLKSKSLLVFSKNLLIEFKRSSSWYSILDDTPEDEPEQTLKGIDRLFALVLCLVKLEKYTNSESSVVSLLANNVLFSFRYTFQSETSNLSVVDHPEWAIDYMKNCVKKYMRVFKNVKSELKFDTTKYFNSLVPQPYSEDPSLLEEFTTLCKEVGMDEIISNWSMLLARETRLFVYSRLPFLVYDYFLENDYNRLELSQLTKVIGKPDSSNLLEVSRSTFEDEKVNSIIYTMINSLVNFGMYLRSFDQSSSYELFSDFDNNTLIPYIMIQLYHYPLGNEDNPAIPDNLNQSELNGSLEDFNPSTSGESGNSDPLTDKHTKMDKFDNALLEMENVHVMNLMRRLVSIESFSDSIGVRSGLTANMYLQDRQFLSQVSNLLTSLLNRIELRCQSLKFLESKRKYVTKVIVPMLDYFVENVKHIWNSLDSILESCTISCLLMESATSLHEFFLEFPLSELMPESLSKLETVNQKMVTIFDQYFVELYYDTFKHVHRQPLEVLNTITHKLLQICALCSYKNYKKIVTCVLGSMEKLLVSILIPNKSIDFILEDEDDVETALNNCQFMLDCVKKLVEPLDYKETMQMVQDMVVILSMETVELNTSAEYLNLLGTTRISGKTSDKHTQESSLNKNSEMASDTFLSSVIYDDFEGDIPEDIHDSLIVSKIKEKLKVSPIQIVYLII
uniref:Uncharacterized protein n=1 Tax=Theileria parva TaxID=5875 RepID=Q4N8J7_THEPA|eukprot:XP_765994.1 hypothetical protein [Theileria parva strain Muguga]